MKVASKFLIFGALFFFFFFSFLSNDVVLLGSVETQKRCTSLSFGFFDQILNSTCFHIIFSRG